MASVPAPGRPRYAQDEYCERSYDEYGYDYSPSYQLLECEYVSSSACGSQAAGWCKIVVSAHAWML